MDKNDDFTGFDRIESVYALNKFSVPITTYAHTPEESGEERITALTQAFQDPLFYSVTQYWPMKHL